VPSLLLTKPAAIVLGVVFAVASACEPISDATASSRVPALPVVVRADSTPGPGPNVDCDRLLSVDEVGAATGYPVQSLGFNVNSCFWRTPLGPVQIVLQTGPTAGGWFVKLQEPADGANLTPVAGLDFEAIGDVRHFGGRAGDRAALLNSLRGIPDANRLIRLVLARL
jgi:hypothetical protein